MNIEEKENMLRDDIVVSVWVIVYNHAKYIRKALDSILSQNTNFRYEIIVHDDASTDGTTDIIKEYWKKYPQIIIPIIQSKNIYKSKIDINKEFFIPRSRGKYVSILEGDDYWTDTNKLQKQVDFLERHTEYIAVVHNTLKFNCKTGVCIPINKYKIDCEISLQNILENSYYSFHLNSIMFRLKIDYPPFMNISLGYFGDLSLRLLLISKGKIWFISDIMSVYRYLSDNSWSSKNHSKNYWADLYGVIIKLCVAVDEYQNYCNHSVFERYICIYEARMLAEQENYSKLLNQKYREFLSAIPLHFKIKIFLAAKFPETYQYIRKIIKK